jgi:hypothetical protein
MTSTFVSGMIHSRPWACTATAIVPKEGGAQGPVRLATHLAALRHATLLKPCGAERQGERPGSTWPPFRPTSMAKEQGGKGTDDQASKRTALERVTVLVRASLVESGLSSSSDCRLFNGASA